MTAAHAGLSEFERTLAEEDLQRRLRYSRIGCWLAMTLMPAGLVLDLVVYPERWGELLTIRLAASALVVGVFLLHRPGVGRRVMIALNAAWVLIVNAGICAMIAIKAFWRR